MTLGEDALLGRDRSPIPPGSHAAYDVVFLDRDGTLNVHRPGYIDRPEELVLLPGAAEAVRALNQAGIRTVLVTNQQGVATGALSEEALVRVQGSLVDQLAAAGAWLDAIQLCPHREGTCACRKPRAGMFLEALRRAPWAAPDRCVMIGDAPTDLEPAALLGMQTRRVARPAPQIDRIVAGLVGSECDLGPIVDATLQ